VGDTWEGGSDMKPVPDVTHDSRHRLPNQRMKLSWRSGRLKGNESILIAAAAPRSLCAIR